MEDSAETHATGIPPNAAPQQPDTAEETEKLRSNIGLLESKLMFLSETLSQKDDLINLLVREKNILEGEKTKLQKETNAAIKDKESIVTRFAVIEEKLLVANKQIEAADKREKNLQKNCNSLNEKMQALKEEKTRMNALLDLKAGEITLRYLNNQQAEKIAGLEAKLSKLGEELSSKNALLAESSQDIAKLQTENDTYCREVNNLQELLENSTAKIADLQTTIKKLESLKSELVTKEENNQRLSAEIEKLEKEKLEQAFDIASLHMKETELLSLNQELSFCNVSLQKEVFMYKSKYAALSMENDQPKETESDHEPNLEQLSHEINSERKKRNEERLIMAKHVAASMKESAMLHEQLDTALGDLEALKKKNSLAIKDLHREINLLRKRLAEKSSGAADGARTMERSASLISESLLPGNALIDRIIRLQQANNRYAEKIEFLENHSSTLVAELQKKG